MNTFSISEALKYGWNTFKINKGLWAATAALVILNILSNGRGRHGGGFIALLATVAFFIAQIGYAKLLLRIKDGESFDWPHALENLFKTHGVFWKYVGTSLLTGIVVGLGLILLIVPGLVAIAAFAFASIIVVDMKMGPIAALKESAALTKGNRLHMIGLIIVVAFLNLVGAMIFGVGLFISLPVTMLAMVSVYRSLLAAKASLAPVAPAAPEPTPTEPPTMA